jgi:hypothetical protein
MVLHRDVVSDEPSKVVHGSSIMSAQDGLRTKIAVIPMGLGMALVAFGIWLYIFPNTPCGSAGLSPPTSCPGPPPGYYVLPEVLLAIGVIAIAFGVFIVVLKFVHRPTRLGQ